MKIIGNDVHIQRGETWALDFEVAGREGEPYLLLTEWKHPYLAITVSAAYYEQEGDHRETHWLDLDSIVEEQADGSLALGKMPRFVSTQALSTNAFVIHDILDEYQNSTVKITVNPYDTEELPPEEDYEEEPEEDYEEEPEEDEPEEDEPEELVYDATYDITKYLFYTDDNNDGNRTYKYCTGYKVVDGQVVEEEWKEYNFRIVKQFNTKSWMEQRYLFDMKILTGETVQERILDILRTQNTNFSPFTPVNTWSIDEAKGYARMILDEELGTEILEILDTGAPLMPDYDTRVLVLEPTNLYVSVNIQGGVR